MKTEDTECREARKPSDTGVKAKMLSTERPRNLLRKQRRLSTLGILVS